MRLLIVDDHQVVRQGLRALLEREGFDIAGEAVDGWDAVERAKAARPDVIVLDLCMPKLNGLDAARELHREQPRIGIVLLTMHIEDYQVLAALSAGIRGYVIKTQAADVLVQAIRDVGLGGIYVSPSLAHLLVGARTAGQTVAEDPLTPRERQVLQLVAEGRTTKEIAVDLRLSVKTAESYRGRLMEKLDIHETAGLVRYAIRRGLIQP